MVVVQVLVEEGGSVVGGRDAMRANQWMVKGWKRARRVKIGGSGGGNAEDLRIWIGNTRSINFQVRRVLVVLYCSCETWEGKGRERMGGRNRYQLV